MAAADGLDQIVDTSIMTSVASSMSKDWRMLARQLSLPEEVIDQISLDSASNAVEMCYQAIRKWKHQEDDQATVQKLAFHLTKRGRKDLANEIERLASAGHCEENVKGGLETYSGENKTGASKKTKTKPARKTKHIENRTSHASAMADKTQEEAEPKQKHAVVRTPQVAENTTGSQKEKRKKQTNAPKKKSQGEINTQPVEAPTKTGREPNNTKRNSLSKKKLEQHSMEDKNSLTVATADHTQVTTQTVQTHEMGAIPKSNAECSKKSQKKQKKPLLRNRGESSTEDEHPPGQSPVKAGKESCCLAKQNSVEHDFNPLPIEDQHNQAYAAVDHTHVDMQIRQTPVADAAITGAELLKCYFGALVLDTSSCLLCPLVVISDYDHAFDHLQNESHKAILKKTADIPRGWTEHLEKLKSQAGKGTTTDTTDKRVISVEIFLATKCHLCNKRFTGYQPILDHLRSENHRKKYLEIKMSN